MAWTPCPGGRRAHLPGSALLPDGRPPEGTRGGEQQGVTGATQRGRLPPQLSTHIQRGQLGAGRDAGSLDCPPRSSSSLSPQGPPGSLDSRSGHTPPPGPAPARHSRGHRPQRLHRHSVASPPRRLCSRVHCCPGEADHVLPGPRPLLSQGGSGRGGGHWGSGCSGVGGWALTLTPGGPVPKRRAQHTLEHGGGPGQGHRRWVRGSWGRPPPPALGIRSHRSGNCSQSLEDGRVIGPARPTPG